MDFRELLLTIWRQRLAVLAIVLLAGLAGAAFASTRDAEYESTATVAITPDIERVGILPTESLSALLGTYAETVESDAVIDAAEDDLGEPLRAEITSTTETGTGILRITARSTSRERAQEAAEAVADAFVDRTEGQEFLTAEILTPADIPEEAVQPRPPLIIATALLVGAGLAVLLALALDRIRRRVESPADVASVTPLPLLGQVPRKRSLAGSSPQVVWGHEDWGDLQEAFRSLRTNLQFIAGERARIIQVTSASAAQGKSTIIANLGVAFAQVGARVGIIDADLRRPAQHTIFEVPSGPGWAHPTMARLAPAAMGSEVTIGVRGEENLAVLSAGPPLDDPTPVLHIELVRVLHALRDEYDLLLVDSPPLLPVADASIIASHVDTVVMAVAAGAERPSTLREALERLELAGVDVAGLVLTRAPTSGSAYAYYRSPGALTADELPERTATELRTPGRAPAATRR